MKQKQTACPSKAPQTALSRTENPVNILLIDDQPIVAESLKRLLESEEKITLNFCYDPFRAIPMAIAIYPTVILLDLILPDIDGLMLLRFLRANPATREIPIVVLSSQEEAQRKAEAFALGASDYLVKFPEKIELVARLRYHSKAYHNFLQQRSAYQELAQLHATLENRVEEKTRKLTETVNNLQQTQAQLLQAEKMSALGQLVAGIAHEINNPVNFIGGNLVHATQYTQDLLELVRLYQESGQTSPENIEEFKEAIDLDFLREDLPELMSSLKIGVDRIKEIVDNMRNFSRLDEAQMSFADLHHCLDSSLLILQHRLKKNNINLVQDYGEIPEIECYPGQLNQVFVNLIGNAIDAVESSGKSHSAFVTGHSSSVTGLNDQGQTPNDQQPMTISIHTEAIAPNLVRVRIADNGTGIPPEVYQQIFHPFFTTKPVGKGTGLGLSISHQIIVEKHGGVLRCESQPGKGTEFFIELPVRQNAVDDLSPSELEANPPLVEYPTSA